MPDQPRPPTPATFLRMSALLADITQDMAHVTRLVSDLSGHEAVTLSAAQITDLQTLDRICQSLCDLVVITESLANTGDPATETPDRLQLAKTRSILSPEIADKDEGNAGTVELF